MKKILPLVYPTCTLFTVYVFLFLLFGNAAGADSDFIAALTMNTVGMLFLLSLSLALLNVIFKIKRINKVLKVTLHYIGFTASYGIILWLFGRANENFSPSMILMFLLVLSIIYFIVLFIGMLIKSAVKSKASENEKYSSMLKK